MAASAQVPAAPLAPSRAAQAAAERCRRAVGRVAADFRLVEAPEQLGWAARQGSLETAAWAGGTPASAEQPAAPARAAAAVVRPVRAQARAAAAVQVRSGGAQAAASPER